MEKKIFTFLIGVAVAAMSVNAQEINLGDFETGGVNPSYTVDSGDEVLSSLSVATNPEKVGNTTDKALLAETSSDKKDAWWDGPRVDFDNSVEITGSHTYLHIMIKTDLPKFELNVMSAQSASGDASDSYNGTFRQIVYDEDNGDIISQVPYYNRWFDYVVDLTDVKGQDDLSGRFLTGFRFAVSVNDDGQQDRKLYIDEIVVNDSPTPRFEPATAGIHSVYTEKCNVYNTANGIVIEDAGNVNVLDYSGRNVYQGVSTGNLSVNLTSGLYIVLVNNASQKVVVK